MTNIPFYRYPEFTELVRKAIEAYKAAQLAKVIRAARSIR